MGRQTVVLKANCYIVMIFYKLYVLKFRNITFSVQTKQF